MADLSQVSEESRRKLPPISPRTKPPGANGEDDKPVKKKRKKKPVEENVTSDAETKTTPRRRRRAASGTSADEKDTGEGVGATKRKKKKPVNEEDATGQGQDDTPRSSKTRKSPRPKQNVTGSKTSLLSKEQDEGETTSTPRTKVKKRKKKKVTQKPVDEDDYTDSGLAADLTSIEDDVIPLDETQEENPVQHPHSTSVAMLKSQPTSKIFIETGRGFKGESKTKMARKMAEEQEKPEQEVEPPSSTTIEFALKTHRIFKTFLLFCHGLTAGIALWHIVIVYSLSYFPLEDFLSHYHSMALPVQCMFYILLVLCTISAFDRHDIGSPNRRFVIEAFTLQSGAVSMVLYFLALVFSVAIAAEADRINLYFAYPELWADTQVAEQQLLVWKSLNTVRGVLAILGWLVISLTPNTDRLTDNLRKSDDLLGHSVEMLTASNA